MAQVEWQTVAELAEQVRSGQRSARELVDQALAALDAGNERLNAFVVIDADLARREAAAVDDRVARGEDPGLLAGVPFGVKDLEDCAGLPTSFGSLVYKGRPPVAESSVQVARMRAAGAIPLGKTAAPEFGTFNFTKTKAWGVTRNPWDPARTPGGSSGGSAAAVSAGLVPISTASDGGGSTRIPAAFCGLVGFKAGYGRIPDPGPSDSQTAVNGILATTVTDAARHLDVAVGPDERDRTSLPAPGVCYEQVIEDLVTAGVRARWSLDLGFATVEPEVADLTEGAARALAREAGLAIDDDSVRLTDPARAWLTSGAMDMWFNVEDGAWPGIAEDVGRYTRSVLEETENLTIPKFVRALRRRAQLEVEAGVLFDEVEVLLTPATAVPAFAAEGPPPSEINGRKLHPVMSTPFTMLGNLCWNPSISVPAGLTSDGLPVGLLITVRRHRDDLALRLARIFEQSNPWPRWAPDSR